MLVRRIKKKSPVSLGDRVSECPRVSGSILTRPKIVVLTSPMKKKVMEIRKQRERERRGGSRPASFDSPSRIGIDRGQASLKSPVGILINHYSLTKYQILTSALIHIPLR